MASTAPRTDCSGLHRSSSGNLARSSSAFSRRSTAFRSPSSPVALVKLQGQSLQSSRPQYSNPKKSCMCSPSIHPGAFRCSLHRFAKKSGDEQRLRDEPSFNRSRDVGLVLRKISLANSLLKIGVAEGRRLLRKASPPPQPKISIRGGAFQRRPSRLSTMSKADD